MADDTLTIERCLEMARSAGVASLEIAHLEDELDELRWKAARFDALPPKLGYPCEEGEFAGLSTRGVNALRYGGYASKAQVADRIAADPNDWHRGLHSVGPVVKRHIERWASASTEDTGQAD